MAKQTTAAAAAREAALSQHGSYVDWAAVSGGAILASAISIVLIQFGGAVGLSSQDFGSIQGIGAGLSALAMGIWIVWVAAVSAMAGAYAAGRCRPRIGDATEDEVEFRDGMHGVLVWAAATLIAAIGIGLATFASGLAASVAALSSDAIAVTPSEAEVAMASFARRTGVVFAFATASGAALAAAVAWFAAVLGGQHRDQNINVYGFVPALFRRS